MSCARRGAAPVAAYVGLGSNVGDRHAQLRRATAALRAGPGILEVDVSPLYETEPVGPPQRCYLNAVARVSTTLEPEALLARLLAIERAAGRARDGRRDMPRTLDLDLLLYGDRRIETGTLTVPHPRLHERAFALEPLRDLAPGLVHPVLGETIGALADAVRDPAAVRRLDR